LAPLVTNIACHPLFGGSLNLQPSGILAAKRWEEDDVDDAQALLKLIAALRRAVLASAMDNDHKLKAMVAIERFQIDVVGRSPARALH
jgi:hypothetical protein